MFANWQSDNRSEDEDEVHDHKDGLELAHDLGQGRSDEGVACNSAKKDGVYNTIRRRPITVPGNDDDRQEHQRETIYAAIRGGRFWEPG